MSIWDRFDNIASAEEVESAKKQYEPIEAGEYDMLLEEIKADTNKDGLPMVKGKFRCVDGGKIVFYNQQLQNLNYPNLTAANIADAVIFVSGLLGEEIKFTGLSNFDKEISRVQTGEVYKIQVSYGKKDTAMKYPKLKVVVTEDAGLPFDA